MLVLSRFSSVLVLCAWMTPALHAQTKQVLVEAESFAMPGGWMLDTQFIDAMGSPYLLAHGMGRPVADAVTTVDLPAAGTYKVFVRTIDWVARWQAPGAPGRFQVLLNDQPLAETFGTRGRDWSWQDGGTVQISQPRVRIALHDLTGFEGRCDAILFTTDLQAAPPADSSILPQWRRELLGLPPQPIHAGDYDLVVVGGGYAGMGSAISAARMGCKVALIQNRPVLGGNGSSEVRVWAQGLIRRGEYPRIGEIVEEFADRATKSPGTAEEFEDAKKEALVRAETKIDLFLNHHAFKVERELQRLVAVYAFDTRSGAERRFTGRLFADCTGHATIGYLAEAAWEMTPEGRMGMSNMWVWDEVEQPVEFPATPWALDLAMKDFPYPRDHHGQWFWESGFNKDPLGSAEAIRDWNFRAVYGAFNAMKNRDGRDQHRNAVLTWIAYIGGPRESRRLLGDVVLTQDDVVAKKKFPDGFVPSTWSIDLHYPKEEFAQKFPDNPFISIAAFDHRVDRTYGYPVPYRCFYSRNIENLFMAGRCISVTHEALGTTRVMKTCGMMGEVVGKAAAICVQHDCLPREVYTHYLAELKELVQLPGKARRANVHAPLEIPTDIPVARAEGPPTGLPSGELPGIVVDDVQAEKIGSWTAGTGLKGYIDYGYLYANAKSNASIVFQVKAPRDGEYELRMSYGQHENRGTRVPVVVTIGDQSQSLRVNMRQPPPLPHGFISLGKIKLQAGQVCAVEIGTEDADGLAHADAVQLLPLK